MREKVLPALLIFTLLLLLAAQPLAQASSQRATTGNAKWTVMVYMAADNNLESMGIEDMNEMELVGSSDDVNIITQFDRSDGLNSDTSNGDWADTRRFLVQPDQNTELVAYEEDVNMWQIGEKNMGDANTLLEFIQWSVLNFPADHYVLNLWGHGRGWKGVSPEGTTDYLSMEELHWAINQSGADLDILGFDVCNLAMLEVFYQIRDLADISIGSEKEVDERGLPYNEVLKHIVSNPDISTEEFAQKTVEEFIRWNRVNSTYSATLSAIRLEGMDKVAESLQELAEQLSRNFEWFREEIRGSRAKVEQYDAEPEPIDLYHLAELLSERIYHKPTKDAASAVMAAIDDAVLVKDHWTSPYDDTPADNANGIAIWHPTTGSVASYEGIQFTKDFPGWVDYLDTFVLGNEAGPVVTLTARGSTMDSNDDGLNDRLVLEYETDFVGENVNIEVYDETGNFVSSQTELVAPNGIGSINFQTDVPGHYSFSVYVTNATGTVLNFTRVSGLLPLQKEFILSGNILDAENRPISGATIKAINLRTSKSITVTSDSSGYDIPFISPNWARPGDTIQLQVSYGNLQEVRAHIVDDAGLNMTVDVSLSHIPQEPPQTARQILIMVILAEAAIILGLLYSRRHTKEEDEEEFVPDSALSIVKYESLCLYTLPEIATLEWKPYAHQDTGELILLDECLEFRGEKENIKIELKEIRKVSISTLRQGDVDTRWLAIEFDGELGKSNAWLLPAGTRLAPTSVMDRNLDSWHETLLEQIEDVRERGKQIGESGEGRIGEGEESPVGEGGEGRIGEGGESRIGEGEQWKAETQIGNEEKTPEKAQKDTQDAGADSDSVWGAGDLAEWEEESEDADIGNESEKDSTDES